MSHSPTTVGPSVEAIEKRFDALLVLDIDEVVLEYIAPFQALLGEYGARLHFESFHLTGNVRSISTGAALSGSELDRLTIKLYEEQEQRQVPVAGAEEALRRLSRRADIVFLTAMTPSYYEHRRRLLDRSGLSYPMIATKRSKGAVVAELAHHWRGPAVFADDLPPNLRSVRLSAPKVHLVHLMANKEFRPHLPPLPEDCIGAADWSDAEQVINRILDGADPSIASGVLPTGSRCP